MKDFRDLKVWEKAHELALACYRETNDFPKQEMFGLISQIRRSGSSIAANIAEGCGRRGNAEFHRFLQIAMGSASELEYHLHVVSRSGLFDFDASHQHRRTGHRGKAHARLSDPQGRFREKSLCRLNAEC
jgi:four helix bundle protein